MALGHYFVRDLSPGTLGRGYPMLKDLPPDYEPDDAFILNLSWRESRDRRIEVTSYHQIFLLFFIEKSDEEEEEFDEEDEEEDDEAEDEDEDEDKIEKWRGK